MTWESAALNLYNFPKIDSLLPKYTQSIINVQKYLGIFHAYIDDNTIQCKPARMHQTTKSLN